MCSTMKTDAGKSAGNPRVIVISASTPPAEAPMQMMSWPGMNPACYHVRAGQDWQEFGEMVAGAA
jgi:hypothetical protein